MGLNGSLYSALVAFSVATILEIVGYYIPWLDHFLDVITTPAAIVAGTVVSASMVTDMSPLLRWSLAIIAGGGAAGVVQGMTVATRGMSLVGTAGWGIPWSRLWSWWAQWSHLLWPFWRRCWRWSWWQWFCSCLAEGFIAGCAPGSRVRRNFEV